MFGNFMDMMGKLQTAQKKFEALKEKLEQELIYETSRDETVSVTITELATIRDIKIAPELLSDVVQLEDTLVITLNSALEKVKKNAIEEAKKTARESLPPIPGLSL
ncbi:MAG: YbaB/EbfC family nucleoid-associated protein [Weeksellaceae bacterium]|nr:YbaB/EbfC family nucleoid-associated protein [Weeksellaceae bacterium]